ncbi:hypothetical protein BDY19DRAFT_997509 [Irpex rosettiformis]|uniref:Uncharacterized protein n=1 Tax=Irpex rosettiformis TaxID=378272 RepID=A0ACB8TRB8_9APHY|nr:hypothetical protein BDY19DRAFT_997509 [Irpex rosettiformis]
MRPSGTLTLNASILLANGKDKAPILIKLTKANISGDGAATPIADPKPTSFEFTTEGTFPLQEDNKAPFLIWKGTLTKSGKAEGIPAFCKIALQFNTYLFYYGDNEEYALQSKDPLIALEKEARLYLTQLKALQGDVVPLFHGYFKGKITRHDSTGWSGGDGFEDEDEEEIMTCIILEDCGEPIPEEIREEDPSTIDTIVLSYRRIHEAGLGTPDFCLSADVVRNEHGKIRVVGFSRTEEQHKCKHNPHFNRHSLDFNTEWKFFGCEDLYRVACELRWLTPGYIVYGGRMIPLARANTTDELTRAFVSCETDALSAAKQAAEIREIVKDYLKMFGQRDRNDVLGHWPTLINADIWPPVISEERDVVGGQ